MCSVWKMKLFEIFLNISSRVCGGNDLENYFSLMHFIHRTRHSFGDLLSFENLILVNLMTRVFERIVKDKKEF